MQIPRRLAPTVSSLALVAGTVFGVNAATQPNAQAASATPQSVITTCGCGGCRHRCSHHHRCWHRHRHGCGWGGWGGGWNSGWSSWNVNINDNDNDNDNDDWDDDDD